MPNSSLIPLVPLLTYVLTMPISKEENMTEAEYAALDQIANDISAGYVDPKANTRAVRFLKSLGYGDDDIDEAFKEAYEEAVFERGLLPESGIGDPFFEEPSDRDVLLSVVGADLEELERSGMKTAKVWESVSDRYGEAVVRELGFQYDGAPGILYPGEYFGLPAKS